MTQHLTFLRFVLCMLFCLGTSAISTINSVSAQVGTQIPYATSFENSAIPPEWIATSSLSTGEIRPFQTITSTWGNAAPYTGNYFLGMHHLSSGGGAYNTNTADLAVDLTGTSGVHLDFWWAEFNDETEPQDGVFMSDNGSTFNKILDLPGASFTDLQWYHFVLDIDSAMNATSMTSNQNFIIRLQQYDNYYFAGGNDGHMYDDINITLTACDSVTALFTDSIDGLDVYVTNASNYTHNVSWDFGDGNSATTTDAVHSYAAGGSYTICMTTKNGCSTDSICFNVDVCEPTLPTFNATPAVGVGAYDFTYTGTGGIPTNFSWDFGDGSSSTLTNPSHTYAENGQYEVILTVTNPCSQLYQAVDTIEVVHIGVTSLSPNNLKIYPNPNNGIFNIEHQEQVDITVYSIEGQMVYSKKAVAENNNGKQTVDLGEVPSGIYFLQISDDTGQTTRKITVQ